jgi:hypothetical protein
LRTALNEIVVHKEGAVINMILNWQGGDDHTTPALWIADHGARPATYSVDLRHSASNRRMDRQSAH